MFSSNAFAAVSGSLPAGFMQWYVGLMILTVIAGTLLDDLHKGSATYYFANWRKTRGKGAPVELDYRLERTTGTWKIYDINVLGLWMVDNYRSSFAQEIGASGIDGLIAKLAERNKAATVGN